MLHNSFQSCSKLIFLTTILSTVIIFDISMLPIIVLIATDSILPIQHHKIRNESFFNFRRTGPPSSSTAMATSERSPGGSIAENGRPLRDVPRSFTPVISPAAGTSPPYISWAASCESSRNGAPGSSSRRRRSRMRGCDASR